MSRVYIDRLSRRPQDITVSLETALVGSGVIAMSGQKMDVVCSYSHTAVGYTCLKDRTKYTDEQNPQLIVTQAQQ